MHQYSFKVPEVTEGAKCHVMPFKIDFTGKTANKLHAVPSADAKGRWDANFRGRPLQGQEVDLKSHILVELRQQEDTNRFSGVLSLQEYIIYEHAADPEISDPYGARLGELLDMATSII